jgi:hypothetical protein
MPIVGSTGDDFTIRPVLVPRHKYAALPVWWVPEVLLRCGAPGDFFAAEVFLVVVFPLGVPLSFFMAVLAITIPFEV